MIENKLDNVFITIILSSNIYIDVFSFFIISIICFYIFFKTKEIYLLTKHTGIYYLRRGFLVIGIASFLRLSFAITFRFNPELFFSELLYISGTLMLIGILYIFFSLFSKNLSNEKYVYIIPLSIALISLLSSLRFIPTLFAMSIMISVGYISYKKYFLEKKEHKSSLYIIYFLLFMFWLLNFTRIHLAIFFNFTAEILSLFSALVFVYILYLFQKRLHSEDN